MKNNEELRRQAYLKRIEDKPSGNQTPASSLHNFQDNQGQSGIQPSQLIIDSPHRSPSRNIDGQMTSSKSQELKLELDKVSNIMIETQNKYTNLCEFTRSIISEKETAERQNRLFKISTMMNESGILKSLSEDSWINTPQAIFLESEVEKNTNVLSSSGPQFIKNILKKKLDNNKAQLQQIEEKRRIITDLISFEQKEFYPSMLLDNNKCQLLKDIGSGGFGSVWKAWDYERAQFVAIKIIKLPQGQIDLHQFVIHIKREIDIMQSTDHKNVVKFYRYFYIGDNVVAYVIEFCENGDLYHLLEGSRFSESEAQGIMKQMIDGLLALRSKPNDESKNSEVIIHYDLKPANILFDSSYTPKIADFGLSKITDDGKSILQSTPGTGTLGYTAPETFSRSSKVSLSADTWSIGIIYMEMLTGNFKIKELLRTAPSEHEFKIILDANLKKLEVSDGAIDFIKKCLIRDPSNRPTIKNLSAHPYLTSDVAIKTKSVRAKKQKT